jgi:hypothetical protein
MSVEVFGDREFIESVQESDGVWALLSGRAAYVLSPDTGRALPVWSSQESAALFASSLGRIDLSPVFIPLDLFLDLAWLGSPCMGISDVVASPRFGHEALTYTTEEIRAKFRT